MKAPFLISGLCGVRHQAKGLTPTVRVAIVLGGLSDDSADACSSSAPDETSFQTAAEYSAEDCPARSSYGCPFARAYTAAILIETLVIAVMRVA
jgi:hypothetical protein